MKTENIYFQGLNGVRAIAAIAVVISHITIGLAQFDLDPYIFGSSENGEPQRFILAGYGVSIFFVLSGFLITYLLQAEKAIQKISIRKFYMRRILRIWPLYYLYLIIAVSTILILGLDFSIKSCFFYVFFSANIPFIIGTGLPLIAHYWSLGVEEQFYVFWPLIVKKINNLAIWITVLIVILILAKVLLHLFFQNSIFETIIHVSRFHCMMIGALGAVLFKNNHALFLNIVDNKITQLVCWFIMLLIVINKFHVASFIDNEIISVIALFIIVGQVRVKNRIVNLENKLCRFLGKISYGIYIIHPIVIFLFGKIKFQIEMDQLCKYCIVYIFILGFTILLSYLSYQYFEKYFLNLKRKYIVVESSGTI